jgi:hypothetical protein
MMLALKALGQAKIMVDSYMTNSNPKKPYILKVLPEEVSVKYSELGNIRAVAKYYNTSPSTMARYFRRNGIKYIKIHKNNFDESFFSKETPEGFYLAGFIAADGNIGKTKDYVRIGLDSKDINFLMKIKDLIKFDGKLHKSSVFNSKRNEKWNDTTNYILIFSSREVVQELSKFNIVPAKTKIYDLPDWLLEHPLVNHYMLGYFDGDGHIGIRNGKKLRWSLVGNFSFLQKYQLILEKNCHIHHNNISIRKDNGLSVLEYTGNIIVPKICQFLYSDSTFHLDRKYDIVKDYL